MLDRHLIDLTSDPSLPGLFNVCGEINLLSREAAVMCVDGTVGADRHCQCWHNHLELWAGVILSDFFLMPERSVFLFLSEKTSGASSTMDGTEYWLWIEWLIMLMSGLIERTAEMTSSFATDPECYFWCKMNNIYKMVESSRTF